jgi:hypothetical protein
MSDCLDSRIDFTSLLFTMALKASGVSETTEDDLANGKTIHSFLRLVCNVARFDAFEHEQLRRYRLTAQAVSGRRLKTASARHCDDDSTGSAIGMIL